MTPEDNAFPCTPVDSAAKTAGPLWVNVRAAILRQVQALPPGEALPTYDALAASFRCSIAPVKRAMEDLARQGWVSLHRGRPARVLWVGSFSRSAERRGAKVESRVFLADFRVLEGAEREIRDELGLAADEKCLVCGRVRLLDGQPIAMQQTWINPRVFAQPGRFFVDHDLASASLRDVYARLGVRPLRVSATLSAASADQREREILSLPEAAPVLRAHQTSLVEVDGKLLTLEVMDASYTQAVRYAVDRLPWAGGSEAWEPGDARD